MSEATDFMTNEFEQYERERQEKDKIIDSMKSDLDLVPSDLYRTHRIGEKKGSSNKPRADIINFVSYNTRKRIF